MNWLEFSAIVLFLIAGAASAGSLAIAGMLVLLSFILGGLSIAINEVEGEHR